MKHHSYEPFEAPISRKLLPIRIIAACVLSFSVAFLLVNWVDSLKLNLSDWVEIPFALPLLAAFLALLASLAYGITDLIAHWIPPGRLRSLLLFGDRSPEQIAKNFEEFGRHAPLLPLYCFVALIIVGFFGVILLAIFASGLGVVAAIWYALSSWPSWAIVITLLLIAILLKQDRRAH